MSLDGVTTNQRETITLDMRQPVFHEDDALRAAALRRAVQSARAKATAVAAEAGLKLGAVLQVIEAPSAERGSGFGDDNDWWGDSSRFAGGGGVAAGIMGEVPRRRARAAGDSGTHHLGAMPRALRAH